MGALDRLVEAAAKSPTRRVHPTARLDGCRAAGTTAVKLLPPYRSAGDARARLPGQSLAWPRLPAHPCVHVARKHGPARWRCPPLRHCAHVDTTVGDHSSVCVLCCPCLLAVKLARRIPTAREGSHARGAPAAARGARALSLPLRRALGKCVCGAQSARPLHGPTRAPIGAERARQSGLGSLGTCPGACQDGCRGPAAGGEGELQGPERTSPPGGICSGVTGDGWVCVATGTIWYYWRSGTLLGPSRALAQRCAAGCASGVTARLSVVGRRSCRWRPGAAAASRAYSSPARAPGCEQT